MTAVTDHDHTDHKHPMSPDDPADPTDSADSPGPRDFAEQPSGGRVPAHGRRTPETGDGDADAGAGASGDTQSGTEAGTTAGETAVAMAGTAGERHARVPEERRSSEPARVPEAAGQKERHGLGRVPEANGGEERHARVPEERRNGEPARVRGTGGETERQARTRETPGQDGRAARVSGAAGDPERPARGSEACAEKARQAPERSAGAVAGGQPSARPEDADAPGAGRDTDPDGESGEAWDDGLIARRVTESNAAALAAERAIALETPARGPGGHAPAPLAYDGALRSRLDALRELVGLSRTRVDNRTLSEAGRVLDEAAARRKLSGRHTVVAIAGATGSGKSQLFNALAGVAISETGVRRPTTAAPIACSWSDGAASLIDRLGIPGRLRRRPLHSAEADGHLRGLVLVDLPDHDSAAVEHREQVDRILKLVDAVIWVVDPEKYADAMLHERYLRPMAGHAEVMFVVLNQIDRLPGEAADQVLDDLRRLLDEDGVALGEFGEPGATVLALSALTGEGVGDLRDALGHFVAERGAAARRVGADVDAAAAQLRPVYSTGRPVGLSEEAREDFAARLADAVGATAAGEAAERAWLRNANRACGTPWLRLWRWYQKRGGSTTGRLPVRAAQPDEEATARQGVEQAVRTVADQASAGLPAPWALAVREAAVRGSQGLSEALDELAARAGLPPGRPPRPGWWPVAVLVQASMTLLQVVGGLWLAGQIAGVMAPNLGVPVLLMICGIVGGPLVEWGCRMAARGPARRYGMDAERRLREAAASCGRARVLDPVAAELLRYREVREQYARVVRTGVGVG
ncbi:GTPase [Streptomyces bungoensis]